MRAGDGGREASAATGWTKRNLKGRWLAGTTPEIGRAKCRGRESTPI
jgi:hypothetical protein